MVAVWEEAIEVEVCVAVVVVVMNIDGVVDVVDEWEAVSETVAVIFADGVTVGDGDLVGVEETGTVDVVEIVVYFESTEWLKWQVLFISSVSW